MLVAVGGAGAYEPPVRGCKRAVIGGRIVCLQGGARCDSRSDRAYHRYGFHCHRGTLRYDAWLPLRQPLRLPRIEAGAACPVSAESRPAADFGVALGPGPVFPVGAAGGIVRFIYPPTQEQIWYGSEWSGQKVLWIARPEARQRVLIRGRQLDGPHDLRFDGGLNPVRELRIHEWGQSGSGWGHRPSSTRLRAPGC